MGAVDANWSGAIPLSNGVAGSGAVFASNSSSQSVAAWIEGNVLRANVQTAPGVWSLSAETVTSSIMGISQLSVAINSNGLIVLAWKEGVGATSKIYASSRQIASPLWSPKVVLSTDPQDAFAEFPQVGINDTGLTFVVWQSTVFPNYYIRYARANPPPAFSLPDTVFTTVTPILYPKIAVGETASTEEAHLLYLGGSTIFSLIFDGVIWSAVPTSISSGNVDANPNFALGLDGSGQAVGVWSKLVAFGIHALEGNFFDPGTSTWGVPTPMSGNSSQVILPTLHISPSGNGILAWELESTLGSFSKQVRILESGASIFGPIHTLATYNVSTGSPKAFANEEGEE